MKILFVTSRFPWPLDKGDKLRAYNQIKYLSKKHSILLFSISMEKVQPAWLGALQPYCSSIRVFHLRPLMIIANIFRNLFSKLPFQSIYFYHPKAAKILTQYNSIERPHKVVLQLVRTTEYANIFKHSNCIIDLMDCLSYHYFLRSKSYYFLAHWFYNQEYRRIKKYETSLLKQFRDIMIISEKDKALLPGIKNHVRVIGNGVEFPLMDEKCKKTTDILFLGNLRYKPNIEAANFILHEILPMLKKTDPGIKIIIAGIDARKKLGIPTVKNVRILENLEDTIHVFKDAKVFVAPMFLSTGIQNKILEAMAARVPVVTSPNVADALGAVNEKHLLTAVSPLEFRNQIRRILHEKGLSEILSSGANAFVSEHCSWKKNINLMENMISKIHTATNAAEV